MEDVLDVYHRPDDPKSPLICLDEASKLDHEYLRNGTANLFMVSAPLVGCRRVEVTERRTAVDFAEIVRALVEEVHAEAEKVVLVMDNLNTHRLVYPATQ